MSIETNLERIANALERIAAVAEGGTSAGKAEKLRASPPPAAASTPPAAAPTPATAAASAAPAKSAAPSEKPLDYLKDVAPLVQKATIKNRDQVAALFAKYKNASGKSDAKKFVDVLTSDDFAAVVEALTAIIEG